MGEKPGTPVMEKGTVSACVLDISRVLGSKKVLFIGQDMCVRADGKYYTDDSSYSDSGDHFTNRMEGHRLPGNTIDEVIVEGRLFVYLKTFEQFIAENKNVEYRNLAATGVKVSGADYITPEDALSWVGLSSSSSPFSHKITELLNNQKQMPELSEIFSGLKTFLENLLEQCLNLAIRTEMLPEKYSVLGLLADSNKVNALVDSNPRYWHILLDGRTKAELAVYKRIVRDIDSPNQNWALVQKNKEYFWALAEGSHWLLDLLNEKIFNVSSEPTPHSLQADH